LRYSPCLAILCPVWADHLQCCPGLNTEPDLTDSCPSKPLLPTRENSALPRHARSRGVDT
jgi:hypothetical protein